MSVPYRVPGELRLRLQHVLAGGIAEEALLHALQVAEVMGVLHEAFEQAGFRVVLVGGGAIEIHAPGIYRSGDLDLRSDRPGAAPARGARAAEAEPTAPRAWRLNPALTRS